MAVRGRVNGAYTTDGGTQYRMKVDADRFLVADFGWTTASPALNQLPRGAHPRHITGVSATTGRRGVAIVPIVTADVWTGLSTTFDIEADDQTVDTMTIVGRSGERPVMS